MPLYQDTGLGGGKTYRALPLPGPALIIDTRHTTDTDAQLLHYLATELDDLTRDMRLKQVYQWRQLRDCFDFLELDALRPDATLDPFHELVRRAYALDPDNGFVVKTLSGEKLIMPDNGFVVKTLSGEKLIMQSRDELTAYVGEQYINRVRNSRIEAINDHGSQLHDANFVAVSPEQSTVRIFFLTDLKEEESLIWAANYAAWLKEWSYTDSGPTRPGRAALIETVTICMNAAPHRHHELLAQVQSLSVLDTAIPALDTLLLIQTYRDDDGYIDEEAQIYQAELLLYTLLLYWPESLEKTFEDTIMNELDEGIPLTRPTFIVGLSALEYSARWGARWLDYGLAAKIIELLCEPREVQREEKQLQFEVESWLKQWWQNLQLVVPDTLISSISNLQAIGQLRKLTRARDFQHSSPAALLQGLADFRQKVSELYTGTETATLQLAIESASLIPTQIKQAHYQLNGSNTENSSPEIEAYKRLVDLQNQAQLFLLSLFHSGNGALPRAIQQLTLLTRSIGTLRKIKQNSPNLQDYRREFEQQAADAQSYLERLAEAQRWPLRGRKVFQQEMEKMYGELCATIQSQMAKVCETIAANVALTLLQWAELYDPSAQTSPYQQRLQRLDKGLSAAQADAISQQELADERLRYGLNKTQNRASRKYIWRNLNNRDESLKWETITEAFLQSAQELQSSSSLLSLLAEMLLRRVGGNKSLLNGHNHRNGQHELRSLSQEKGEEQFQALSTALVANLLLATMENVDLTDILPLLDLYAQLKQRYLTAPSILDSEVLNVRQVIKEAMLERAIHGNKSNGVATYHNLPTEFVLAAWVGSQHATNPSLAEALDSSSLLTYLADDRHNPSQILNDLRNRNKLIGYEDPKEKEDSFYLLLPPGESGEAFLKANKANNSTQSAPLHTVYFPDIEKLIYMHVHRIRHIQTLHTTDI